MNTEKTQVEPSGITAEEFRRLHPRDARATLSNLISAEKKERQAVVRREHVRIVRNFNAVSGITGRQLWSLPPGDIRPTLRALDLAMSKKCRADMRLAAA